MTFLLKENIPGSGDTILKKIFLISSAYAIIQIVAQDLGIKTGKRQRDLIQSIPVQFLLFVSSGYIITDDYLLAIIATLIYFYLKYVYSKGITSKVCFEEI